MATEFNPGDEVHWDDKYGVVKGFVKGWRYENGRVEFHILSHGGEEYFIGPNALRLFAVNAENVENDPYGLIKVLERLFEIEDTFDHVARMNLANNPTEHTDLAANLKLLAERATHFAGKVEAWKE